MIAREGRRFFALTALCGEQPIVFIEEINVIGEIPGYGFLRRVTDTMTVPCAAGDVFRSESDAKEAAAARLRKGLADISACYERKIEELSA